MKRFLMALLLAGAAGVLAASCGDGETADGTTCTPGEEIFCRCKGGGDATKTCLDDGESYGECSTVDGPCPEGEEDDDDDDDDSDGETFCTPFDESPCTCDDGSSGIKECDDEGAAFGDCMSAGVVCAGGASTTSASSGGSSSSSGGGGTLLLFAPCSDGAECVSGSCQMGFCTLECGNYGDCIDEGNVQGECARFQGGTVQVCAPPCVEQADCIDVYGEQSRCGFGVAPDDPQYGFTACGDWGSELDVPPEGWECDSDVDCHLNLYGAERICYTTFGECVEGCWVADDCPEERPECSSSGATPGTCG